MTNKSFTIGVIISTYNNPDYLKKTLWGYCNQTIKPDEVLIADDGSKPETAQMLKEEFSGKLNIKHIWHEDIGFRKTMILNKALLAATADYLILTDHDCVPREDFIETHIRYAAPGKFLSGGYFRLPMSISKNLVQEDVINGNLFSIRWLLKHGTKLNFKCTKLFRKKWWAAFMNFITPANASWNGMNSSTWREEILAVKGFDERMAYGGLDRELGERLMNNGIKGKQIRYSAITMHLDHSRPYMNEQSWALNNSIRKETRTKRIKQTAYGIKP